MIDTPKSSRRCRQLTAFIHLTVRGKKIRNVMAGSCRSESRACRARHRANRGRGLRITCAVPKEVFDFEICLPVNVTINPAAA